MKPAPPPEGLQRVAAIVEYDGTAYEGLQRQSTGPTIQSEVEAAIRRFGVEESRFRASGRTDSGVHARGQVIAFDFPQSLAEHSLVSALNWHLPEDIRLRRAALCDPSFDPRRDARLRTYRYLLCGGQPMPALARMRMGRVRMRLELEAMQSAAHVFQGEYDFRAWRSSMCQARRTVLKITRFDVEPWADRGSHGGDWQTFMLTISCRSFLHRMVRLLVGGVVQVGGGELGFDELGKHLREATLPPRVVPADACGLSLECVDYPNDRNPFLGAHIPGLSPTRLPDGST